MADSFYRNSPHLYSVPELVLQIIVADAVWIALRQKYALKSEFETCLIFLTIQGKLNMHVVWQYFKNSDNGISSQFSFASLSSPLNDSIICKIFPALSVAISL